MIKPFVLFSLLATFPAIAGSPLFVDRSEGLPAPDHIYSGDWEHFVGGGVAVLDCDGDAFPDLFVAGGESPARLMRNTTATKAGDLQFEDLPIQEFTSVTGAYPLDIDSDGYLDLAILRVGPNKLLKGAGDCTFEDASAAWGFASEDRWTTAFSATWEGDAAFPTLAFGNYVDRSDPDGPFFACDATRLYRPNNGKYDTALPLEPGFCALSILFSDWSRKGSADLRISNDRHYYVREGYEQMWSMDPLRLLGEVDGWRRVSIWGMGIASEDLDGDSRPDVMLTSMGDQLLQFNEATGYRDAPYAIGSTATRPHTGDDGRPSTGWHAQFGDVDNNGLSDLFIAKGNVDQMPGNAMKDPNNLLIQQENGTFVEAAATAGIGTVERSRGAGFVDLNQDGLLDVVVINRRAPMELWQNTTPDAGNWLSVSPFMADTNTHAVGGWLEWQIGSGAIRTREITVGGGHASGQAGPLHIGLGTANAAQVRMRWPDGAVSDWMTMRANQHHDLQR